MFRLAGFLRRFFYPGLWMSQPFLLPTLIYFNILSPFFFFFFFIHGYRVGGYILLLMASLCSYKIGVIRIRPIYACSPPSPFFAHPV